MIDYGCGKFFDKYGLPGNYAGYDPYNRDDKSVLERKYDVALCSNVLNVIMEPECRRELLNTLRNLADKVYITVYEGNGSGIGKPTKSGCYQCNRKKGDYFPEIAEVFGADNVKLTHGYYECAANN